MAQPSKVTPAFLGDVGEGAVTVVVVEAALAVVGDEDVGEAVVVVVGGDGADAPAVVGDAGFCGDVGEGAVVVVVEEGGGGWFGLAGEGVVGAAVDEVDVEPAVVVVVEQGDAGAEGFDECRFLSGVPTVLVEGGEAGPGGDVLKDDGAGLDEAAGGDGAVLRVVGGGMRRRRWWRRCWLAGWEPSTGLPPPVVWAEAHMAVAEEGG